MIPLNAPASKHVTLAAAEWAIRRESPVAEVRDRVTRGDLSSHTNVSAATSGCKKGTASTSGRPEMDCTARRPGIDFLRYSMREGQETYARARMEITFGLILLVFSTSGVSLAANHKDEDYKVGTMISWGGRVSIAVQYRYSALPTPTVIRAARPSSTKSAPTATNTP